MTTRKRATETKSVKPAAPAPATHSRRSSSARTKPAAAGEPKPVEPRIVQPVTPEPAVPPSTPVQDEVNASFSNLAEALQRDPSPEEVARLAYHFWESRGGYGGSSDEDWFRAEQELRARAGSAGQR